MQSHSFNKGLEVFMQKKHISKKVIPLFFNFLGIDFEKVKRNQIDIILSQNFDKFHSWVDSSIKNGTISGSRKRKVKSFEYEQRKLKKQS